MTQRRELLLSVMLALVLAPQGQCAAVPLVYESAAPGAQYPLAMEPVQPFYGAVGGGGIGASPLPLVPASPLAAAPGGLARPLVLVGAQGDLGGGGGGFQQKSSFANDGAAAGHSGYRSTGAYEGDDRHIGDKMGHSGYYSDVGMDQKGLQNGGLYEKGQTFGRGSNSKLEDALNNGYKQGKHSSGFQSSYHKDESGHDTRFYDDDHNEGLHAGAHNFGDYFGARGLSEAQGHGGQGHFQAGSQGQQQHFGSGLHEDAKSGQHNSHANEDIYGQKNGFNQQMAGGMGSFGSGHNANMGQVSGYRY